MLTNDLSAPMTRIAYAALFVTIFGAAVSISIFQIGAAIFTMAAILAFSLGKRRLAFGHLWVVFVFAYFAVNALSLCGSENIFNSAKGLFRVFRCVLLALSVVYIVDDEKKLQAVFRALIFVAFFVCLDALVQGSTGREWLRGRSMTPYSSNASRWTGPFPHANDFGGYLSFAVFLFIGAAFAEGGRMRRFFYAAGAALSILCLLETYSRGAWVSVLLAGILFIVYLRDLRVTAVAVFAFVLLFAFAPASLRDRAFSLADAKNNTMLERKELWGEATRMIREHPLLGHGVNMYAAIEPRYKSGSVSDNQYAHNGYLQMTAETGLLGLLSFLLSTGYFLIAGYAVFSKHRGSFSSAAGISLVLGVFSLLMHSATDTDLHSVLLVNTLWLGMGLGWAALRFSDNSKDIFRA